MISFCNICIALLCIFLISSHGCGCILLYITSFVCKFCTILLKLRSSKLIFSLVLYFFMSKIHSLFSLLFFVKLVIKMLFSYFVISLLLLLLLFLEQYLVIFTGLISILFF